MSLFSVWQSSQLDFNCSIQRGWRFVPPRLSHYLLPSTHLSFGKWQFLFEMLHVILLLAIKFFTSFGLLNNSLPCFSISGHLNPILNLHFPQILSDVILPSYSRPTNPQLHYSFHRPFFIHSYNMPSPSHSNATP